MGKSHKCALVSITIYYNSGRIDVISRVEQPVGTGFSTGKVTATTEEEIAADFVDFFLNFQEIFGIKNFKIYVTGESYAGRYVPYISAAMLDKNDTEHFNLSGEYSRQMFPSTLV